MPCLGGTAAHIGYNRHVMTRPIRAKSFADLKPLRQALADVAAREARRAQERLEAERRARDELMLFQNFVGPVKALKDHISGRNVSTMSGSVGNAYPSISQT